MAGLIIGVVGVLLGGIGLAKVSTANKNIAAHEEKLARLDALEGEVKAATDKATAANNNVASLSRQTQDAFTSVGNELGNLRTEITKMTEARKAPAKGANGAAAAPTGVTDAEGNYVIASGDTLGKVAKKFGVSVADLETANPGVDSKHLRPGQKIKIPKK